MLMDLVSFAACLHLQANQIISKSAVECAQPKKGISLNNSMSKSGE